ncbi:MAG: thiamine-monophosphate kinase, partial [Candidatus Hodarchaeota archaeon]
DLGSAVDSPVLAGVALGFCKPEQLMSRDGIKAGDPIYCTGTFGLTGLAFANLYRNVHLPKELERKAIWKALEPKARVREGLLLGKTAAVTGSIDSSDGLALSLHWLAEGSKVGIELHELPIDSSVQAFCRSQSIDPLPFTLYGGEEFELVVALDQERSEQICKALKENGVDLIEIGHATNRKGVIKLAEDPSYSIEKRGWDSHRGFI